MKQEETIWCQNQIIIWKVFLRKPFHNKNEKKTEILMNKPVCLGLSLLALTEILMYEFWYNYVKPYG